LNPRNSKKAQRAKCRKGKVKWNGKGRWKGNMGARSMCYVGMSDGWHVNERKNKHVVNIGQIVHKKEKKETRKEKISKHSSRTSTSAS
jgi:hypothetical protein